MPYKRNTSSQFQDILSKVGNNIKCARKRRKLTTTELANKAGIDRTTLYYIERGSSSVSMGAYFNVLIVLGLHESFLKLGEEQHGEQYISMTA